MSRLRTGDQSFVKEWNTAIILDLIRQQSPISRAAIAKLSGLNKATVSSLVDELIAAQLVRELGPGKSSGGRRPQMLIFNDWAGYVAGVEVGVGSVTVGLMDLRSRLLWQRRVRIERVAPAEGYLAQVAALVAEGLGTLAPAPLGLLGLGAGLPALVDHEGGRLIFAPNLGWRDLAVRDWLTERLQVPVYVDNEANASALAERWVGVATGTRNLVYLSVGAGLGAGIILDGELFRGADGVAGELGHTSIDLSGPVCGCGSRGCWEVFASASALCGYVLKDQRESVLAGLDPEAITPEAVVRAAEQGDAVAISALSTVGEYLGIGIANLVNSFNPSLVVIGSDLAAADHFLINPAYRMLERRALAYPRSRMQILRASLGAEACVIGAGALVLQERFRLPAGVR